MSDAKKAPDPAPDCPRCYYFAHTREERAEKARQFPNEYPGGIDQQKALVILTRAFPRAYGTKG